MSIEKRLDELAAQTARDVWALEWSERDNLTPLIRAALAAAAQAQREADAALCEQRAAQRKECSDEQHGGSLGRAIQLNRHDEAAACAAAIRSGR